jgi:hypothetical protein
MWVAVLCGLLLLLLLLQVLFDDLLSVNNGFGRSLRATQLAKKLPQANLRFRGMDVCLRAQPTQRATCMP